MPTPRSTDSPSPVVTPVAPGAWPLLGHAPKFLYPWKFFGSLPALGGLVRIRLLSRDVWVVCSPDLTHQVLTDDRTYDKGGLMFDHMRDLLGNGLASCVHADHRARRRLVQPAFHHTRMPVYTRRIAEQAAAVIGSWTAGSTIDVYTETVRFSRLVTGTVLFATPVHSDTTADDVLAAVRDVALRMVTPAPLLPLVRLRSARALRRLNKAVDKAIAFYRASDIDHDDVPSILVSAHEDGTGLTDEQLRDEFKTLFAGGVETASSSTAWAMHLLARHPDVQDRLRDEVDRVVNGPAPTWQEVKDMTYTARVVDEALRLYPPIGFLSRVTTRPADLGGHRIPAGATVLWSAHLTGRDPDVFPDPDRFDPDRPLHQPTPPPRGSLVAFGGGGRRCVGDVFGRVEMTMFLALAVRAFTLRAVRPDRTRPRMSTVTVPRRALIHLSGTG